MKIFCFILSVLILALSLLPCMDQNEGIEKDKTEVKTAHNGTPDHSDDACSPLCQCLCCASLAVIKCYHHEILPPPFMAAEHCACLPADVIEIPLVVWKPPRIS